MQTDGGIDFRYGEACLLEMWGYSPPELIKYMQPEYHDQNNKNLFYWFMNIRQLFSKYSDKKHEWKDPMLKRAFLFLHHRFDYGISDVGHPPVSESEGRKLLETLHQKIDSL